MTKNKTTKTEVLEVINKMKKAPKKQEADANDYYGHPIKIGDFVENAKSGNSGRITQVHTNGRVDVEYDDRTARESLRLNAEFYADMTVVMNGKNRKWIEPSEETLCAVSAHNERVLKRENKKSIKTKTDKPLKYPKIHNKLYTVEHVHDLIARAIRQRQYRDQWDGDSAFCAGAEAHFGLKSLVEMLENIVVFNIGDGVNGFNTLGKSVGSNLSARLDSFIVAFHYKGEKK